MNFLFRTSTKRVTADQWIVDSGATCHVASDKDHFQSITDTVSELVVANGEKVAVHGSGTCSIKVIGVSGNAITVGVRDVLYAPAIDGNLLSVRKLLTSMDTCAR